LRDVEKIPLSGGRRKHAITVPPLAKRRGSSSENKFVPFSLSFGVDNNLLVEQGPV